MKTSHDIQKHRVTPFLFATIRLPKVLCAIAGTTAAIFAAVDPALAGPPQYESGQVHPLDRIENRVLAVNTPDSRLSIFDWTDSGLVLESEVKVGMEPVTVRAKSPSEAWVVNHLSDDISVIDLDSAEVVATIRTGDEPTDVAFVLDPIEDDGSLWAVICLSQEDRILVLDAEAPYAEIARLDIPGSDPRALTVDPTRNAVWVAVFESGNNTTVVDRDDVNDPGSPWGGNLPPFVPPLNPDLPAQLLPDNTVIVRKIDGDWLDEQNGDWSSFVTWDLFDIDLVRIDIGANPSIGRTVTNVGTLIEDVVVQDDGTVWAINLEAQSEVYFEEKLKGEFVRNRITRVLPGGTVEPFGLNGHISFGLPGNPNPASLPTEKEESLTYPTEVLISPLSGSEEIYVTAMGGQRIAVIDPADGTVARRLSVSEGATGLIAHPERGKLLILDRLTNELAVVDPFVGETGSRISIGRSGWDPTEPQTKEGRQFLYTGSRSAHGTTACASCHPYANLDNIAWDLGDPTGELVQLQPADNGGVQVAPFHPLKGPMTTQTLRGLKDSGRFHWRGDRADVSRFNPAFVGLLGGDSLSTSEMTDFEAFVLSLEFPPNPFRTVLDEMASTGTNGDPNFGQTVFNQNGCVGCHSFPLGTTGQVIPLENIPGFGNQPFKIPQLRNLYEKTGFDERNGLNKRGFGYLHDGLDHDLTEFVSEPIFNLDESDKPHLVSFLMNFGTETHPATGVSVTFDVAGLADSERLALYGDLLAVVASGENDFVAHGNVTGEERGFVWTSSTPTPTFQSDRASESWTEADFIDAINNGAILTFMSVPPGEGIRMGIDRDLDGAFDRDELDTGSDPADPDQTPSAIDTDPYAAAPELARFVSVFPAPFVTRTTVEFYLPFAQDVQIDVYDVEGRNLVTLARGQFEAGRQQLAWDGRGANGRSVPAGNYFLQLRTEKASDARKVIRLD